MNNEVLTPKTLAVLVIDDNPDDRDLISICLKRTRPFEREATIETADDAREALEKMHERLYSLILLDWNLPLNSHGYVLFEMRRQGVYIPVVIVSGLARPQITADLSALGAAYLDKKDLSANTLYSAIEDALHQSQALLIASPTSGRRLVASAALATAG